MITPSARAARDVIPSCALLARPGAGRHVPALDGLRGVAVLMVVAFHIFQVEAIPTGSLPRLLYLTTRLGQTGVDLFFVLSGFLITGILVDAKGTPRYFLNFYGRRTVRIFPLYYGVLVMTLVLMPRLFGVVVPSDNQVWLWTYTANIPVALGLDRGSFGHFWTLAIEEQFYVVWPAVVFLAGRTALIRICLGCIAGAVVARVIAEASGVSCFSFTPCRMDSLTLGAFLALVVRGSRSALSLRRGALAVALGTAVVMVPLYISKTGDGDHWVQVVKFTPIAAFYGALLILAITSTAGTWTHRLLTSKPLLEAGRLSYGIYIFQSFAIQFAASRLTTSRLGSAGISATGALWVRVIAILGLTYAMARLSWHLYEKPFLGLKKYFEPRRDDEPTGSAAPALRWAAPRPEGGILGAD